MAKAKPLRTRRQAVRTNVGFERRTLRAALGRRDVSRGLVFGLVFWAAASAIVLSSYGGPDYRVGQVIDRPVVARVDVKWLDEELTERVRQKARNAVPATYVADQELFKEIRLDLITLPGNMQNAQSLDDVAPELRKNFALKNQAIELLRQYQVEGQCTDEWAKLVDALMAELRRTAIITGDRAQSENSSPAQAIRIYPTPDASVNINELFLIDLSDRANVAATARTLTRKFPLAIRPYITHYLSRIDRPTYIFDKDATDADRQAAAEAVKAEERTYRAGEVMVPASRWVEGEAGRRIAEVRRLGTEQFGLLKLERERYAEQLSATDRWLKGLAPSLIVLLVTAGMGIAVLSLRPRVVENPMRGLALVLLLLASLGAAALLQPLSPYAAGGAAVVGAMLACVILTIAYDQRFAVAIGSLHGLLIGLALGLSLGMALAVLAACLVAIAQLYEVRQRGTLVRVGFVAGLVGAVAALGAGLVEQNRVPGSYEALAWEAGWVFGGAVVVGFFINGTLRFIESTFRVTTALTLLELCDVNRPLLRKLAQAAPGTYNHSLNLAVLAENAAEAIGAHGLMCRVGALYHDIGKMNKPQYFIENQGGGPNRHDKLSPAMSLLIITGHVKDGVEMAREYGLPSVLHHFIASHHGTTLVEYFYHAAKRASADGDDQAQPSEFEFRYPGPKPQTREAAILMLADTVESASRTLDDPSPNRIEQLVHKLAMKRLMDGQFDDSALTLEELHRVEESFTKTLAGIYHGRIKYPAGDKKPASPPDADATADHPTDHPADGRAAG